jgi:hypothetical protein
MSFLVLMGIFGAVDVQMQMTFPIVFMFVGMNLHCFADPPKADGNQKNPHQPLAPMGNLLKGQKPFQKQRNHPDHQNAAGVADSPAQTGCPSAATGVNGKWRNGRKVIRARQNMQGTGDQTCEGRNHIRLNCSQELLAKRVVPITIPTCKK